MEEKDSLFLPPKPRRKKLPTAVEEVAIGIE